MKNKYRFKIHLTTEFEANAEDYDSIYKNIEDVLSKNVTPIFKNMGMENNNVHSYLWERLNITEKEKKEELKQKRLEKQRNKYIDPQTLQNEDIRNVYFRLLQGMSSYYFKKLIYVDDTYLIFKVLGRTEHIVRTEYGYSPAEWFVINLQPAIKSYNASKYSLQSSNDLIKGNITAFYKEGRLTKEDKQQIYKIIGREIKL